MTRNMSIAVVLSLIGCLIIGVDGARGDGFQSLHWYSYLIGGPLFSAIFVWMAVGLFTNKYK